MLVLHRVLRSWIRQVDVFVALTRFARDKFLQGGLPPDKVVVKPNFVHPDPGSGEGQGGYALFVGRLSQQKGIPTLLDAWARTGGATPLMIVGAGPLETEVSRHAGRLPGITWLGSLATSDVYQLMGDAAYVILPSESYENFPLVAAEAFSKGTAVIASDIGALAEIVKSGTTGLLFRPGNAADLAEQVEWARAHPREVEGMGRNARREYEAKYTADDNYRSLMDIYGTAMRLGSSRAADDRCP
jgi:glycosyltransferase involved in cell wall biosynthesis